MEEKTLNTPHAYWEIKDGILHVTFKRGLSLTYKLAKEMIQTRLDFCNNKAYPVLIMDQGIVDMDKEARDLFSSEEGTVKILATALVLGTIYNKMIGGFFIKTTHPAVPVQVFKDQDTALEWLKQFKSKSI